MKGNIDIFIVERGVTIEIKIVYKGVPCYTNLGFETVKDAMDYLTEHGITQFNAE